MKKGMHNYARINKREPDGDTEQQNIHNENFHCVHQMIE